MTIWSFTSARTHEKWRGKEERVDLHVHACKGHVKIRALVNKGEW